MTSQLLYLVFLLATSVLLRHLWSRRQAGASKSALPLPPGPPPLPVIGNVHQAPKSHSWLQYYEWSKTYGPVMHLNMAGQPIVILSSVQAAQDLITRRGAKYSDRPRLVMAGELAMKGMHIMLRSSGDDLRAHQRLQAPFLTPAASDSYRHVQDTESRQLLHDLFTKGAADKGIDFHHELERTVASTTYTLIYGHPLASAHAPQLVQARTVQESFNRFLAVGAYIVDSLPVLQTLPLPSFMTPWKEEAEINFNQQRDLHMANMRTGLNSASDWNFTKGFFSAREAGTAGVGMSDTELAFDLGILSDAALDTTTMTLDWFIVAWVTQSEGGFMSRAQKQLDDVVGPSRLPSFEDRAQLPFVSAIVEEVLRWRPIVGAGVAHALLVGDDEYMGYRIPKGSVVLPNHWAITRDPAVFGKEYNVEEFVPERWLDSTTPSGIKDDLAMSTSPVFGYGRRICPGRHIARNSLWIIVARLLWAFSAQPAVEVDSDEENKRRVVVDPNAATNGLLTKPLPFNVQFQPRGEWASKQIVT